MQKLQRDGRSTMGKLAVLMPGLGAVSTTLMAGVELMRRRKGVPVGSLAQLGTIKVGSGNGSGSGNDPGEEVKVSELVPLASLEDLVFGAWDIVDEDAFAVAKRSEVLSNEHLSEVRGFLEQIRPRAGVHDPDTVRRIHANNVIDAKTHREKVAALRQDIRKFIDELGAERAVMVFCASTEVHRGASPAHESLRAFEKGLDASDPMISPTMLYAYAALQERVPFVNGTPNLSVDTPALQELAHEKGVPMAGKDLKSGQTMMKTVVGPMLKTRLLGLNGWFSTNILGNRDGEVLDDPQAFRSKEITKGSVLESMLSAEEHPELYAEISHKIAIHYYPPRGDAKEGWDNIDLFGWLGYPMQIKINFLCRDSILAAPLVLDLALFADLAMRHQRSGLQEWLSFYFKSPTVAPGHAQEHDLFAQRILLENELRAMAEESRRRPPVAVASAS